MDQILYQTETDFDLFEICFHSVDASPHRIQISPRPNNQGIHPTEIHFHAVSISLNVIQS
jgi:hypothetical protein